MAKIGALKVQTPEGVKELPVYSEGDSGTDVIEALKVQTDQGIGFVPLTNTSDAAKPYIKLKASDGLKAVHDSPNVLKVIDDFEDGDMSEYTFNTDNSSKTSFSIDNNSPVYNGNNSLKMVCQLESDGSAASQSHLSDSGLSRYPSQGDVWEVYFRISQNASNARLVHKFGSQSTTDTFDSGYGVYYRADTGKFIIVKSSSADAYVEMASKSISSLPADTWFKLQIQWSSSGDITASIVDTNDIIQSQISANDTDFTDGAYGYYVQSYNATTEVAWDYAEIVGSSNDTTNYTTGMIDDFEDGDITEYDSADMNSWSTQTSTVFSGTNALEFNNTTDSINWDLISDSGLARYPQTGDTFQTWVRSGLNRPNAGIKWAATRSKVLSSRHGGYAVSLDIQDNAMTLYFRDTAGNYNQLAQSNVTVSGDTWYRIEVSWASDGSMTATLYDSSGSQLTQLSATDTTRTSGGFGYLATQPGTNNSGEEHTAYFDKAEITSS